MKRTFELKNGLRTNYCIEANNNILMNDCNKHILTYDKTTKNITSNNKCFEYVPENGIILTNCNNNNNQQFIFKNDSTIRPVTRNDHCLDVQHGSTKNGTPVQIWRCNGKLTQIWEPVFDNGGNIVDMLDN